MTSKIIFIASAASFARWTMIPFSVCLADKFFQIFVEMFDHLGADGVGLLAFFPPIRQGRQRVDTPVHTAFGVGIQGDL